MSILPIQQYNAKYLFGIRNMLLVPHPIQLLCPNQGHDLLEWVGSSATMLVFWHILLYSFLAIVDSFIYIFAWADCHAVTPLFIFIGLTLAPR